MKRNLTVLAIVSLSSLFAVGCKKELISEISNPLVVKPNVADASIPSYVFDWETATYMPSPTNYNQVQMPWNSGTTAIDASIVSDYKKVDGWELVYNTFSPTTQLNDPSHTYFFTLYNKYRGQLRFYLWQQASSVATSYITHGLSLYPTSVASPMLNYNAASIIAKANQSSFSQVLNQQINASGGTWFVMQYEIAYDPKLSATTFPSFGLKWTSQWVNVSTIKLNGTQTGTLKGTVGSPAPDGINIGDFFASLAFKGAATFYGTSGASAFLSLLDGKDREGSYLKAASNAGQGIVSGFLSGLIGGATGGGNQQPISLTMDTKIDLTGSSTSNGGLEDIKLALPGQANSQTADGYTPAYLSTMGVFSLSNTPVVKRLNQDFQGGPFEDPQYGDYYESMADEEYTLDNSSFQFQWNPAIVNGSSSGVSITNLKTQIVLLGSPFTLVASSNRMQTGGRSPYVSVIVGSGNTESIAGINLYPTIFAPNAAASIPNSTSPLIIEYSKELSDAPVSALRISFDVIPNSGAPSSKIVKTFYVNILDAY